MTNHIFRSSLGGFHRQDVIDYIEKVQKASAEEIAALEEELNAAAEREMQIREVLEQDVEEIEALKEQLSGMEELRRHEQEAAAAQAAELSAAKDEAAALNARIQVLLEENRELQSRNAVLESDADTVRREKEQVAQLELEARRRAAEAISAAEAQAAETIRSAEEKAAAALALAQEQAGECLLQAKDQAEAVTAEAEAHAKAAVETAQQQAQEQLAEVEARIAETAQQCNELADSFGSIAAHVMTELRRMDVTASQLPISFNHLRDSMQELLKKAQDR